MQPLHYAVSMPTLARVGGLSVRVYAHDHDPPHFHVVARDGREAVVEIDSLAIIAGRLPRREAAQAIAWARENREHLQATWKELSP